MESKKYLQIYEKYASDIISGKILPNEKLISKRVMAKENGVSINTVITALDLLEKEGYIKTIERVGSIVCDHTNLIKRKNSYNVKVENKVNVIPRYDLTTANVDRTLFPRSTFSKITKDVLYNDKSVFDLGSSSGEDELKIQISKYLYNYRRIDVDYRNIIIASGSEHLLSIITSILPKNTIYGVEDPGYSKISDCLSNLGKDVVYYRSLTDALNQVNAIYVTPEHQFPRGYSLKGYERITLSNWAVDDNYIIEDDYDGEFRYEENIKKSIISLNNTNTIYISSFSRTLSQSIRISYMILPDKLKTEYDKKFRSYSCQVSKLDQIVVSKFIESKYYERLINKSIVLYKKKRDMIIDKLLNSNIKDHIRIEGDKIGLHLLVNFDKMLDEKKIEEELVIKQIKCRFVNFYSKCYRLEKSSLIIGYSNIDINDINNCMDILLDYLSNV